MKAPISISVSKEVRDAITALGRGNLNISAVCEAALRARLGLKEAQ